MKIDREKLDYYLGTLKDAYFSYAADENIRHEAASGGTCSALLIGLLQTGKIDGAVLARTVFNNGRLEAESFIAENAESILQARGSVYMDFDFWKVLPAIKEYPGSLAVVALPCQILALRKMMAEDIDLKNKVKCLIGLFCGHISRSDLIYKVLEKAKIDPSGIERIKFRTGHWRGRMSIWGKDGLRREFPFKKFGRYQNLFFHCAEKCLSCNDHTAEAADISLGDLWDRRMKKDKIKQNALIVRNNEASELVKTMSGSGVIKTKEVRPIDIFRAQKRSLICHKHIEARRIIGRFFGYRIPVIRSPHNLARWNDLISAFFIILNTRASRNETIGKIIFRIPQALWLPYLYLMKILINF